MNPIIRNIVVAVIGVFLIKISIADPMRTQAKNQKGITISERRISSK